MPPWGSDGARLGCGAAIVVDGRMWLFRRLREPEAGFWSLPGGKIDWLEPVEHAVRREILEELGITLIDIRLLCVADLIDEARGEHWLAPVYLSTAFGGSPCIVEPEKHADLTWFSPDRLPQPLGASARPAAAR